MHLLAQAFPNYAIPKLVTERVSWATGRWSGFGLELLWGE